jgi:NAD(P)-dependent dehydrogenase (short-subunit alcohol dehydrogenase family)
MSVVLVTGSSSGIGLATAIHFGRSGWEVYAGLRDLATATELHQTIATESFRSGSSHSTSTTTPR